MPTSEGVDIAKAWPIWPPNPRADQLDVPLAQTAIETARAELYLGLRSAGPLVLNEIDVAQGESGEPRSGPVPVVESRQPGIR
jgi:hypothetical protein